MSTETREALAALMVIAAECAQRKPLRGFEELTEATHIGHRQFGRAHEQADEAVRMLAVRLRAVFDTLAAALATQPAQPSAQAMTGWKPGLEPDDTDKRAVRFIGTDPLDIAANATLPMVAESWRFGFRLNDDMTLTFTLMDDGPLVAYAAVSQPSAQGEAMAWLVEWKAHGHGPQWWGFNHTPGKNATWCSDANNAIRFARKEDAERMRLHIIAVAGLTGMHSYERSVSVTEHLWEGYCRAA